MLQGCGNPAASVTDSAPALQQQQQHVTVCGPGALLCPACPGNAALCSTMQRQSTRAELVLLPGSAAEQNMAGAAWNALQALRWWGFTTTTRRRPRESSLGADTIYLPD